MIRRLIACVLVAALVSWSGDIARAAAATAPECTVDTVSLAYQDIPKDVCADVSKPMMRTVERLRYFDALAWQTFKMLIWPASQDGRGKPDDKKTIGAGTNHDTRTFETYKADWETFLPHALTPTAWDSYEVSSSPCEGQAISDVAHGDLVLAARSEFGNVLQGDTGLAGANFLVAQNGTYVRYLAAYGPGEYQTLLANGLYNADVVSGPTYQQPHDPNTYWSVPKGALAPDGTIIIKSAWVELTPGSTRFYTRQAWVQDPKTLVCHKTLVGLVGLHIVHKTPSRPQWIWSTFEHVDNVADGDSQTNGASSYTFNSGDNSQMPSAAPPGYVIQDPAHGPDAPPAPFNVERVQQIAPLTSEINRSWQDAFGRAGSVWRYYKLVMTQWPLIAGVPDDDGLRARPIPTCDLPGTAIANTVLETFFQKQEKCLSARTCMGCHNLARNTDFVWSIPMNPYPPPVMQYKPVARVRGLKALEDVVRGGP